MYEKIIRVNVSTYGVRGTPAEQIVQGSAEENGEVIQGLLNRNEGNVQMASDSIDSGSSKRKLWGFVEASHPDRHVSQRLRRG